MRYSFRAGGCTLIVEQPSCRMAGEGKCRVQPGWDEPAFVCHHAVSGQEQKRWKEPYRQAPNGITANIEIIGTLGFSTRVQPRTARELGLNADPEKMKDTPIG